jgi:hypothetical protein
MIDKTVITETCRIWIFDYDNDEWERVRALCLEEDNWLRENYLPHRCKISDHKAFFIAYFHDGRPIMFGGLKEFTPNVARMFNRMYGFPYLRSVKDFHFNHSILAKDIMPAMEEAIGHKYDLMFVSMQQRARKYAGKQGWWKHWCDSWFELTTDWKVYDGLVQTYPAENATCYQNIVYRESENYKFSDWNPNTLTYTEYQEKFVNVSE